MKLRYIFISLLVVICVGLSVTYSYIGIGDITDIDMAEYIISSVFEGEEVKFNIAGVEYIIPELFKAKLEYEKNFLRNKGKAIDSIVYKIKKFFYYLLHSIIIK